MVLCSRAGHHFVIVKQMIRERMCMGRLYVAYGSNMIEDQMQVRCPDARLLSKEMLPGYQLECRDIYSGVYLNAIEDSSSSIPVYVWEIKDGDEENLDEYEGYYSSYKFRICHDVCHE